MERQEEVDLVAAVGPLITTCRSRGIREAVCRSAVLAEEAVVEVDLEVSEEAGVDHQEEEDIPAEGRDLLLVDLVEVEVSGHQVVAAAVHRIPVELHQRRQLAVTTTRYTKSSTRSRTRTFLSLHGQERRPERRPTRRGFNRRSYELVGCILH